MTQEQMLQEKIDYLERGIAQMEKNNGTDYVIELYKEQLSLVRKGVEFFGTFREATARATELNRQAKETGKYFGVTQNKQHRNYMVVSASI